jgi:hypothetical protein
MTKQVTSARDNVMARKNLRAVRKSFRLDPAQIARAKEVLGASTETETIVRALEHVFSDAKRNRMTLEAHYRFLASGIQIREVFGRLSD